MINVNVNFDNVIGKVKPMHATNNMVTLPRNGAGWDERMQAAHIPFGRLHDTGGGFGGSRYVDIPNVFPDFDADENDPASYDFAFTDVLIERMVKSGVMPYYRLGVTIENYVDIKAYRIYPPKDYAKWARICEHIIMHYNEGWADGFHYNIEYWEIWNEPDNYPDINENQLWRGTMEEFFELYKVAAKHLKSRFPNLKIGGYGSCGFYAMNNVDVSNLAKSTSRTGYFIEFFHKFFQYAKENEIPVDFFDWHTYAGLKDNILFASYPRKYLDEYGYKDCEIHVGEWNPGTALRGTLRDASNILSTMIALHSTPTDMMLYYDFRYWSSYCGAVNPLNFTPFKAYYSFYTFGQLYAMGKCVECNVEGEDVYALAATDGEKKGLAIVNHFNTQAITVNVKALGADAAKKICVVDEDHDFEEIEANTDELTIPANAIVYVEY